MTDHTEAAALPSLRKRLLRLFLSTLYLSAFTFGGGYVIVTLLKRSFVDKYHWISEEEMLELVAIAQSAPGAIAVNGAIVVGYKLAGFPGILVSVLGAVLPPFLILSIVSLFYNAFRTSPVVSAMLSGMRAGVCAVITSVVFEMGAGIVREKDLLLIVLMLLSFIANYFFQVSVVLILCAVLLLGLFLSLCKHRKNHTQEDA